ncbi:hypothetical protein [Bradyrhizobium guangzhouense]|uniref:hypothetical protein n=1 Tax=Bradyrhizobium guangzhouense TaxID=1325095 RepID=UPI0010098736|nr:hypothetical protein [Bradyrhizobium guangzhouense]
MSVVLFRPMTTGKKWVRFVLLSIALSIVVAGIWIAGRPRIENVRSIDDPKLDRRVLNDLDYSGVIAELTREKDNYYEFGISPEDGYGGVELLAFIDHTGHFEKIWSGQDIPPCYSLPDSVPIEIARHCSKTITVDRASPVISSVKAIWGR